MPGGPTRSLLVLAALSTLLLASLASASTTPFSSSLEIGDPRDYGGSADLEALYARINATSLILNFTYYEQLYRQAASPPQYGFNSFRVLMVGLDADSNPLTGCPWDPGGPEGLEIMMRAWVTYGGSLDPTFSRAFKCSAASWIPISISQAASVGAPLGVKSVELSLSRAALQQLLGYPVDYFRVALRLYTVLHDQVYGGVLSSIAAPPQAIVVDADPSEWLSVAEQQDLSDSPYPESDVASFKVAYNATSNRLYVLFNLSQPFDSSAFSSGDGTSNATLRAFLMLDLDGDNVPDVAAWTVGNKLWVVNMSTGAELEAVGKAAIAYRDGVRYVEAVMDLSPLNATGSARILDLSLEAWVYDDPAPLEKPGPSSYLQCSFSRGLYLSKVLGEASKPGSVAAGSTLQLSLSGSETQVSIELTAPADLSADCYGLYRYNVSPTGFEPGSLAMKDFYSLVLTCAVSSVEINVTYTDSAVRRLGIDESRIRILYFNETAQSWQVAGSVDAASNTIRAVISSTTPLRLLRIAVGCPWDFEVAPIFSFNATNVSQPALHTIYVSNTGAVSDTYTVSITAPGASQVLVNGSSPPLTFSLAPGETASLVVSVTYSSPGSYEANVTITSQQAGISFNATLQTFVPRTYVVARKYVIQPGQKRVVEFGPLKMELELKPNVNARLEIHVLDLGGELPAPPPGRLRSLPKTKDISIPRELADILSWPIGINITYSDEEVRALGIDERTLRLYYWNGTAWVPFRETGVDPAKNVVWAKAYRDELVGSPVAPMGSPLLVGGELELPRTSAPSVSMSAIPAALLTASALCLLAARKLLSAE